MANDLLPTRSAIAFLGSTKATLLKYARLGELKVIELGGVKHYAKEDLEKLLKKLKSARPGRPGGTSKATRRPAELKAVIDKISGVHDLDDEDDEPDNPLIPPTVAPTLESLGIDKDSNPKQIVTALQKRITELVVQHRVLETLVADLSDPDWKARQAAANSLLGMVVPKIKSTEVVHSDSAEKSEQKERSIALMRDIKLQIQAQRQASRRSGLESVKALEIEAIEIEG